MLTKTISQSHSAQKLKADEEKATSMPTKVLWRITAHHLSAKANNHLQKDDVRQVARILFPGIDYYDAFSFNQVFLSLTRPALRHMHPGLEFYASGKDAEQAFGKKMLIKPVLESNGFEWTNHHWRHKLQQKLGRRVSAPK